MDLIKIKAPAENESRETKTDGRKVKFYRHPMDPGVHSNRPAKDSMGMDYIPVYEDEAEPGPSEESATAKGRGPVTLTPEQDALSGGKPIRVEARVLRREIEAPGRVTSQGRASFQIFEQDFSLLKVGQEFVASSPSLPGESLRGRILAIASILDPMTRTARVEGSLSGPQAARLRPESTVTGMIRVETARVVAIPEAAIMRTGTEDIVFVTDGKGSYQPRPVSLGIKAQGYYEVAHGLGAGTMISSGPNFLLDSEARVRAAGQD